MTFALVDCNNFYASCEKLFRPDLRDTPVVVLSNNDGCIVARSKEAKALGIKMGVPVFKVRDAIQEHGIKVFSSNYALYADISDRVMGTLDSLAPRCEVYSIDESFLDLSDIPAEPLAALCRTIRHTIGQWIGIQVCVGVGPTKTLAKLANYAAKKYPATDGVVDISDPHRRNRLLAITPIEEIWGVGKKLEIRLKQLGLHTALDLAQTPPHSMREQFSVVMERTIRELNGESCIELEEAPPTKKEIVCSRSFGHKVTEYEQMREAICEHVARAGRKIRAEKQQAKFVSVFIRTSPFVEGELFYSNSASGELVIASDDTRDFTELAMQLLKRIWRDGHRYIKGGVMLSDFYDVGVDQQDLFNQTASKKSDSLMSVIDQINHNGTQVFFASQGIKQSWAMKREQLSPAYTTRWGELPKVN